MGLAAKLREFMGMPEESYYEEDDPQSDAGLEPPEEEADGSCEVVLSKPERFDEASSIVDHLNANRIVVLNLESTQMDVARRLIDFVGGAAYARNGKLSRVAGKVYLVTPFNVEYMDDEADVIGEILF